MDNSHSIERNATLTEGPVGVTLISLAIPMIWGMFSIIAFNLADAYFVGQLGHVQLAALSFTFPVVMTIGSITIGLGVGVSSVLARAIGEGDQRKVQSLTTDSLALAIIFVGIFVCVGYFTIDPLFRLLHADDETLPFIGDYMRVWYLGMMFLVIPMIGNNAIRASGDTVNPSIIMTISAVINIALDPVLIFGFGPFPHMGIRGAALATVFARAVSMVASLAILHYRKRMLSFQKRHASHILDSWKQILHVGLPAAGTYSIGPVAAGIVTAMLAKFGSAAVAAFGVATRIESFSLIALFGLSTSVAPFVGQNFGARRHDRVSAGLRIAFLFSLIWGLIATILLAVFARTITGFFTEYNQVISVASMYLYIVPVSFGAQGIVLIASSAFNALGRPMPSAVLTLTRMLFLYIPLAFIGRRYMGPNGIFAAACAANFATAFWALIWIIKSCKQQPAE